MSSFDIIHDFGYLSILSRDVVFGNTNMHACERSSVILAIQFEIYPWSHLLLYGNKRPRRIYALEGKTSGDEAYWGQRVAAILFFYISAPTQFVGIFIIIFPIHAGLRIRGKKVCTKFQGPSSSKLFKSVRKHRAGTSCSFSLFICFLFYLFIYSCVYAWFDKSSWHPCMGLQMHAPQDRLYLFRCIVED